MNIKSHGKVNLEQIVKLEETIGFTLPKDYKEFLLETNGGSNKDYDTNKFWVKELDDYIVIDVLFGVDLDENIDIKANLDMFSYDMLPETILIGDSIQHGFIVMICNGPDKGIYYWDHSYVYEVSNDEGNMYWVAESFDDFLKLLNK